MMKVGCQISQITKTDGWGRTESFGDILPCFFNLYDFKRDSSQDAKILMIPTSLNRCRLRVHLPTPWNLKYLACLSCSNAKESKKPRYFSAYVLPPPLVVCLPLVSWTDETSGAERLSQNQRSTNEWCLSSQKKKYKKWWFWCMSPSEALLSIVLLQINTRLVWTSVQLCTRSRSSLASLAPLVRQVPWALLRVWPSAPLIWNKWVSGCHLDLSEFWTAYSARCSNCAKQRPKELEITK